MDIVILILTIEKTKVQVSEATQHSNYIMSQIQGSLNPQSNRIPFLSWVITTFRGSPNKKLLPLIEIFKYYKIGKGIKVLEGG